MSSKLALGSIFLVAGREGEEGYNFEIRLHLR